MISKTTSDIRTDITTALDQYLPNLDISSGTPEADLFVEAPIAGQLSTLWNKVIYTAKLHAPHTYSADLETDDLLTYMSNFNVIPTAATYASGVVTFYTNSAPAQDVTIPDGAQVRTSETTPTVFAVQGTYIMYASLAASYYNATTARWEISCSVLATVAGPTSRAGTGTVTKIVTSITGIAGVTNGAPITGGAEAETTEDALDTVLTKFQGRGLGPTQGLINYIQAYVEAVNVVGANDVEMLRDEGLGGAIDFYIIGETLTSVADTVTITSTGLATGVNVKYTSTGLILINQPVHGTSPNMPTLIVNDVPLNTTYYTFVADTGILKKSTGASDMIQITSTGLANGACFKTGDVVEVTYKYNSLLHTIEDDLNSTSNHYQNRDYLCREMTEVTINVYMQFKELSGQDFDTLADTVELNIATFIDSIKNAGSVELADIIGVAKIIPTVDNINIPTVSITNVDGGTKVGTDIFLTNCEYPVAGTITLIRWTN